MFPNRVFGRVVEDISEDLSTPPVLFYIAVIRSNVLTIVGCSVKIAVGDLLYHIAKIAKVELVKSLQYVGEISRGLTQLYIF